MAAAGLVGVTEIDVNVAAETVRADVPEIELSVAEIVVDPVFLLVARPLLDMVATDWFDELQVTVDVIFSKLLSEYIPIALNCCVVPLTMVGLTGMTVMDDKVGALIVNVVAPDNPFNAALIVLEPTATPVASPLESLAFDIVALV